MEIFTALHGKFKPYWWQPCEGGFSARRCAAAIFIDIKSAFDSAWSPAILAALIDRHCPIYLVRIVDSFLCDRLCVFDFDPLSTYEVHTGCPQGSVISPFLRAVLIDDALRFTLHPRQLTVAFADDITVVSASLSPVEATMDLQRLCDSLVVWLKARKLDVCPAKSTVLIVSRRPSILERCGDLSLSFCEAAVPRGASKRFLGFTIDQKLNWCLHIVARCIAAKRLLFACRRYLGLIWGVNKSRLISLYTVAVEPVLLYGCSLWVSVALVRRNQSMLRSVQRLLCSMCLKTLCTSPSLALILLCAQIPVDYRIIELSVNCQARISPDRLAPSTIRAISVVTSSLPPISS